MGKFRVKCDYCEKNIFKWKHKLRLHNFCNIKCHAKWRTKKLVKTKICSHCNIEKSYQSFSRRPYRKHLLRSWCKKCSNQRTRERRANRSLEEKQKHREENNLRSREYRKNHLDYAKENGGLGKYRYARARFAARRRGCTWKLNRNEYYELIQKPCVYCGKKIEEKGIGLDKINPNLKSYCIENVVPCCKRCNWIKLDWLTFEQMKKIGKVIKTFK